MHKCIICSNNNLESVFDLGLICPSTFLKDTDACPKAVPLKLVECPQCHLVQLSELFNLDDFYRQYWYQSGLNSSMVRSLKDVVTEVEKRTNLKDNDLVLDLGCNDATLFALYSNQNLYKVGIDPALNLKYKAEPRCDLFINDYFNGYTGKAKVITAIAMFYDVIEPHKFLENITSSLDDDGIFVVQMTDLLGMIYTNAFDNICMEHACVYSLKVLNNLFNEHNLEIFDLAYNDVNGSSLRVYTAFKGKKTVSPIVSQTLNAEEEFLKKQTWDSWKKQIDVIKEKVVNYIKGKNVYVLGASTKGNTLLQYFDINNKDVVCAADINSDKFGLKTVATNIPIISETQALTEQPDVFLVLPWHFRKQIVSKNQDYLDKGGKFLFPLPTPQIVSKEGTLDI